MATVRPPERPEDDPRVAAVFADIRATRGTDFVGNVWRHLAFSPTLLESTWRDVKALMGHDSALDAKTKEMLYVAVSTANACGYCVHSHTAAAKAHGMTEEEHAELVAVVALAARTNHLLTGLQVPVDEELQA